MSSEQSVTVVKDIGRIKSLIGDWWVSSIGGLSHAQRETAYCCTAVFLCTSLWAPSRRTSARLSKGNEVIEPVSGPAGLFVSLVLPSYWIGPIGREMPWHRLGKPLPR